MATEIKKSPIEFNPNERGDWTSASAADADSRCAGRHLMQRGIPEEANDDAQFGTTVHDSLAAVGTPEEHTKALALTVDQREIYDSCREIEDKVVAKYFGVGPQGQDPLKIAALRERRFWCQWSDGNKHSGQIDVVRRSQVRALIIEYKTLSGQVASSPRNLQLRDQVCLYDAGSPLLQEVAVAVVQPLVTHTPEITIYSRADIKQARAEMYARVAASNKVGSPRTAGEVQCKYCRAKSKCPEYQSWAGAMAVNDKNLIDLPVEQWTPEQRALYMDRAVVAYKWLEMCDAKMKELIKADPKAIPGYTLKDGKNRETITNPQEVFDRFSQLGGSLEQFMDCIKVGKTDLKEKLALVGKLRGKALEGALETLLAGCSTKSQDAPSIVKVKA